VRNGDAGRPAAEVHATTKMPHHDKPAAPAAPPAPAPGN